MYKKWRSKGHTALGSQHVSVSLPFFAKGIYLVVFTVKLSVCRLKGKSLSWWFMPPSLLLAMFAQNGVVYIVGKELNFAWVIMEITG